MQRYPGMSSKCLSNISYVLFAFLNQFDQGAQFLDERLQNGNGHTLGRYQLVHQRLQQRIPPVLVELDIQLDGHVIRQVKQLLTAGHRQQQ